MDSVFYLPSFPWPAEADGLGPSLELISPDLDNLLASSWHAFPGMGTPGADNHYISGMHPEKGAEKVTVFPNPGHDRIHLQLSGAQQSISSVRIFDLVGRLWGDVFFTSPNQRILLDIAHLPPGQFALIVILSDGNLTRVMIQKV
jgi:hypothetical protein